MPVFVPPEAFDLWLDCANVEADVAAALIRPAAEDLLEAYEVSTAVNRVANDSEALIEPVSVADAVRQEAVTDAPVKKEKPKKAKKPDGQPSLL